MAGVKGCGSTRGDQGVVSGVAPFFGDVHARGARHLLGDDLINAPRRILYAHVQLFGQSRDCLARLLGVEFHRAAQEKIGIEIAQKQARVRDGGLRTALGVAGGPRHRARALRADPNQPQAAYLRDAAAARADLDQVHRGREDGQAASLLESRRSRHLEAVLRRGFPVFDQAYLGRGSAHVEAQNVILIQGAGDLRRRERAARRP